MFFTGSRYAGAGTYQVTRADGTVVTVTRIPLPAGTAGDRLAPARRG